MQKLLRCTYPEAQVLRPPRNSCDGCHRCHRSSNHSGAGALYSSIGSCVSITAGTGAMSFTTGECGEITATAGAHVHNHSRRWCCRARLEIAPRIWQAIGEETAQPLGTDPNHRGPFARAARFPRATNHRAPCLAAKGLQSTMQITLGSPLDQSIHSSSPPRRWRP